MEGRTSLSVLGLDAPSQHKKYVIVAENNGNHNYTYKEIQLHVPHKQTVNQTLCIKRIQYKIGNTVGWLYMVYLLVYLRILTDSVRVKCQIELSDCLPGDGTFGYILRNSASPYLQIGKGFLTRFFIHFSITAKTTEHLIISVLWLGRQFIWSYRIIYIILSVCT